MSDNHDLPCSVPPHPSLLARVKTELKIAKEKNDLEGIKKASLILNGETGIPGLNDGSIYPKSHYTEPASIMSIAASGLNRSPLRGAIRVLVVLVDFLDYHTAPNAKEKMEELWFSEKAMTTGSVNDYFTEVSHGLVSLTGDVVGPVVLGHRLAYYSNHLSGRGSTRPNLQSMANEVFDAVKDSVDFNQYDNDDNGYVDAFVLVHAGRGAEHTGEPKELWSVKWTLPEPREADGVNVFNFASVPEDASCGVCAHELGHLVFGWPDLWEADHSSSGVGNWCLMGYGVWNGSGQRPVHPSAWFKMQQGWIEVITEANNRFLILDEVKTSHRVLKLWTDGDVNSKEYFLLENRQTTAFDEYLPGSGLLIWHIDESVWTNVDEAHLKVKLIQADGLATMKGNWGRGDSGDAFPGFSDISAFGAATNPSSRSYSGTDTFVTVTNIPISSPSMTFNITVRRDEQAAGSEIDSRAWYRLKNAGHKPDTHCLDVINDNSKNSKGHIEMRPQGDYSGQYWHLESNNDGTFFVRTLFLGRYRNLDVYSHDKQFPYLHDTSKGSGQYWVMKSLGDGTCHLYNAYSGQFQYLDIEDGSINVRLRGADSSRSTQRWILEHVHGINDRGY